MKKVKISGAELLEFEKLRVDAVLAGLTCLPKKTYEIVTTAGKCQAEAHKYTTHYGESKWVTFDDYTTDRFDVILVRSGQIMSKCEIEMFAPTVNVMKFNADHVVSIRELDTIRK